MAETSLSRDRLRRLAELHPERGRVLSVFLNLDPSQFATAPAKASAVTSIMTEAAQQVEDAKLDHDERQWLRADLERVRELLTADDLADDGTQAVAVYACEPAELLESVHLPRPLGSRVVIDDSPFVEPLVTATPDGSWVLMLANRRSARLFSGAPGALEETDRIEDNVHQQHSQGGWSQARYERSVDQDVENHLKGVADVLFRRFKLSPFDHLLIGAPEETLSDLEGALHPYLRERVVDRIHIDVENSGIDDVRAAAVQAEEGYLRRREREALDRLEEGVGRGGRAAAGLDEVLSALNEYRVEILLLGDGFEAAGYRDTSSGLITSEDRSGPVDEAALERVDDLVEVAIEKALEGSAEVMRVRFHDDLDAHGGIGAVLRY
jgi:peptide subunit release factor 1 (eRF1)